MKKTILFVVAAASILPAVAQHHSPAGHGPMTGKPAPMPFFKGMSAKEISIAEDMMKKGTPEESRVWSRAMMNMVGSGKIKESAILAIATKGMSKADVKILTDSYGKLNKDQQAVCRKMLMNMATSAGPKPKPAAKKH